MDQKLPGYSGSISEKVQKGTHSHQDAVHVKPYPQDRVPLSAHPSANQACADKPADTSTTSCRSSANLTSHSDMQQHGPPDSTLPNEDTHAGYLGSTQRDGFSQRMPTHDGIPQARCQSGENSVNQRNMTIPATSRPFKKRTGQLGLGQGHQHEEIRLFSKPSGIGHEKKNIPNFPLVRHGYDRHELSIFEGERGCDTTRGGTGFQGLGKTRVGISNLHGKGENTFQAGLNNLSSSRERVPTPGLSRILGPAPTNHTSQRRCNKPTALQQQNPGIEKEGAKSKSQNILYYDYSEAFETPTTSPGAFDAERSRGRVHDGFYHGTQVGYEYGRACTHHDGFSYSGTAFRDTVANPSSQGSSKQSGRDQRMYIFRGAPDPQSYRQQLRVPLQECAYDELYKVQQGPRGPICPPQYWNRGNGPRAIPDTQAYRGTSQNDSENQGEYRDSRGCSGGYHKATMCPEQHRDPDGCHRRYQGDGRYRQNPQEFKDSYSKRENMSPSHVQVFNKVEAQNRELCEPRVGITQAHRRVQNMMKALIPRGLGQGNRSSDRPALRISRPIPLVAPHPVSPNIGQRLAENVLSINDDEMLPAGLRNLQNGPSGQSDDGFGDIEVSSLSRDEPRLGQSNEPCLRLEPLRSAPVARKNELCRPRLIARLDSTKKTSKNVYYASPKNVDFQNQLCPQGRTPYPAETLTELEHRGVIRTKAKHDADADSRNIDKPEHDRWESTKMMFANAKEDVMAKLGIKTKRVREAEKLGYTLLTRHAKASIPTSDPTGDDFVSPPDRRRKVEEWRRRAADENDEAVASGFDVDDLQGEDNGNRTNMTTAVGHAVACNGMREGLIHLKEKTFRSKPELRTGM